MKLYEVPNKTWVRIKNTEIVFFFDHPDGMYSFGRRPKKGMDLECSAKNGAICHFSMSEEVEILNGI